ncbi:T-cell surface glycoprotein CD8 alpha chain isoform X1 [Chiloscyllium plagiosum]|uniref:T-cell surface glycoprotein CD8 alpha chain isoform X1 n=1 Tax=Chiloscyllium plagiosum TaxID=36176 RepID=UPI001CB87B43|nr:T-cell surface glycoprotein CD8 alpha chain isoform X1 [Chiloscyllium plagiosum]XP_043559593.1 T-cell surface glycoprotein CD8 alpha chain isoform X1 [Chiloscyllium plagiosum]
MRCTHGLLQKFHSLVNIDLTRKCLEPIMKILGFLLATQLISTVLPLLSENKVVKKGGIADVMCSLNADEGVYWFQQPQGSKPKFLLYVTGAGKVKALTESDKYNAAKSSTKVSLTVKNFQKEDAGKYYCFMVKNMAMRFGDGIELYFEEVKTTPKPTTVPSTTQAKPTTQDSKGSTQCHSTQRGTRQGNTEVPMSCHLIIWAPLTGAAVLLLLALTCVSIAYCRRPRRRRCQHQFRKRPIAEEDRRPQNRYL